ncbi:hypothetical protein SUGI_0482090 [Cryptomeria japonica]|uniref:uncharacterized protein LOC131875824 n=1 Tax=Cryptomeria japonica TaxID=3369 RepID=UPI002408E606|nr:uncharacterized protein LOC131875824 [Cryptomeria japonica]GLJ25200.1 hypothetical protein SUGI_0482090 [Cryptomeria japonica]
MNFDGACKGNPGVSGYGAIIRDEYGDMLGAKFSQMGVSTNNIAEVTALEAVLECCVDKGVHKVLIEGNSQVILNGISNQQFTDWKLNCWIPRIQHLISHFSDCSFIHSYQEGNSAADCLANTRISSSCPRQLSAADEIPDALLQILIREKSSIPRAGIG